MSGGDRLRVGRVTVGLATAAGWVSEYTDPARIGSNAPYAFPAYDRMDTESDASRLNDGDLLAPALLNVTPKLRAFYALKAMRTDLEERLARLDNQPLENLDAAQIAAVINLMYDPLDRHRAGPRTGLNGTTYSKVLHRKRLALLPLHDRWINACYVSHDGPVPPAKKRTWSEYMTLVAIAMAEDLSTQRRQFDQIADAAHEPLTRLRLLDIVAWKSQGRSHE
ncbi:DUF6308 family protein [Flexivirga meconopsidis]|uniref:DUF6308 family protein n=1 Tax=Flexivirga meconopsidis TaxID=2977121 RepID=UPI00223FD8CE|nr:DUF6308 family protein [Flexivirga meconopsidis]